MTTNNLQDRNIAAEMRIRLCGINQAISGFTQPMVSYMNATLQPTLDGRFIYYFELVVRKPRYKLFGDLPQKDVQTLEFIQENMLQINKLQQQFSDGICVNLHSLPKDVVGINSSYYYTFSIYRKELI